MLSVLLAILAHLGILHPAAVPAQDVRVPAQGFPLAAVRPAVPAAPVKNDPSDAGITVHARGAAVIDWKTGALLAEKDADTSYPIASITKLLTAIVITDRIKDWDQEVTFLAEDERPGGIAYLLPGERVTVADLFNLSLVASSNGATVALARSTGLSAESFAIEMNVTADRLGLRAGRFVEPTGLDSRDSASARDVAILVRNALAVPEIAAAVRKKEYQFTAKSGRSVRVRSTDELLGTDVDAGGAKVLGGKTGYLVEAGYCFGAMAESRDGHRVVAVVLGAPTKEERFTQVHSLITWAFGAYSWSPNGI
jgi:D-alanyl-D-alanine carboxypeptidase